MTEVDGFYLFRAEQAKLADYLTGVPQLCIDLAVTIVKLDRTNTQIRVHHSQAQSELDPLNFAAMEARDKLHTELVTWVALVCEQRRLELPTITNSPQAAVWLKRHIIALALTKGSGTALACIESVYKRALRHVSPGAKPVVIDPARVDAARDDELSASGIECAARELGEEYRHLTRKRVNNLHQLGHIEPVRICSIGVPIYRLGDVLDAHLRIPNRKLSTRS